MKDELEKIIQKAAIDGTLTEDAARRVHEALAENRDLKKKVLDADHLLATKNDELAHEMSINSERREELAIWEDRESKLAEREKKMTELELEAKHHAQRVLDHQTMFGQVFRNVEVRRNVFTPTNVSGPDQFGSYQHGTVDERQQTETIE